MNLELLVYLNLVLLTRLAYLANDGPLSLLRTALLGLAQIVLISGAFAWNLPWLAAVLTVLVLTLLALAWQSRVDLAGGYRLLSLLALVAVPTYAAGLGEGFRFTAAFQFAAVHLGAALPWGGGLDRVALTQISSLLFGMLLLANETNILVRAAFHHLRLEPRKQPAPVPAGETADGGAAGPIDRREYNAGRVIGILERWLMYLVVVMSGDLSALAFIIAAKGLVRLKQLEDRDFAEYMLVGTLLSALSAVLVGFWIAGMAGVPLPGL